MYKTVLVTFALAASAAFSGSASATNREDENVVGRASDRILHPIRSAKYGTKNRASAHRGPIHTLKHAHPIRRLEGR